jgi:hypothetical protein
VYNSIAKRSSTFIGNTQRHVPGGLFVLGSSQGNAMQSSKQKKINETVTDKRAVG